MLLYFIIILQTVDPDPDVVEESLLCILNSMRILLKKFK